MMRTSRSVRVGRVTRRGASAILAASCLVGLTSVASAATTTGTPTMTSRGFGLSVHGNRLLATATVPGAGDSGAITTTAPGEFGPFCAADAPSKIVGSATGACGAVVMSSGAAGALAWADDVTLDVPMVGQVSLAGVRSIAEARCDAAPRGASTVNQLTVAGQPVRIAAGPNTKVVLYDRENLSAIMIFDQQIPTANSITVNAARLLVKQPNNNNLDVVIGSSSSTVTNCDGFGTF